jgi:hypothetical protein
MAEIKEFATSDLALAGYLKLRGLELAKVDRSNPRKAVFYFDDSIDVAEQLVLEFANSDFRKYDAEIRALKKLIHR